MIFSDREEAAEMLADALRQWRASNPLVAAIRIRRRGRGRAVGRIVARGRWIPLASR
jgi:predicted phosphoribosyltransferase